MVDEERILLVEDDPAILAGIAGFLKLSGFVCEAFSDGSEALTKVQGGSSYALAVVDLMLPGASGYELTKACATRSIPVIMITARTDIDAEMKGFDLGVDDYLIKPFNPLRLLARIRKHLGKEERAKHSIRAGALTFDLDRKEISREGETIRLTPIEYEIMLFFAEVPNRTVSRDEVLDAVWGVDFEGDPNLFNVHLSRIRQKFSDPDIIRTVGRLGFIFEADPYEID